MPAAPFCYVCGKDPDLPNQIYLHTFPVNPQRVRRWLKILFKDDKILQTHESFKLKTKKICSRHFPAAVLTGKRLSRFANPWPYDSPYNRFMDDPDTSQDTLNDIETDGDLECAESEENNYNSIDDKEKELNRVDVHQDEFITALTEEESGNVAIKEEDEQNGISIKLGKEIEELCEIVQEKENNESTDEKNEFITIEDEEFKETIKDMEFNKVDELRNYNGTIEHQLRSKKPKIIDSYRVVHLPPKFSADTKKSAKSQSEHIATRNYFLSQDPIGSSAESDVKSDVSEFITNFKSQKLPVKPTSPSYSVNSRLSSGSQGLIESPTLSLAQQASPKPLAKSELLAKLDLMAKSDLIIRKPTGKKNLEDFSFEDLDCVESRKRFWDASYSKLGDCEKRIRELESTVSCLKDEIEFLRGRKKIRGIFYVNGVN